MNMHKSIAALAIIGMLAACSGPQDDQTEPDAGATVTPNPDEPVSILRPDVEQPEQEAPQLEPLNVTLGFPDGGSELDADVVAALEEVLATPQYASGGPIVLRAHSDSGGTDKSNADASQARGLAVAGWLTDMGVNPDRIEVIVFGEQNPIEPNALPDGSPNEAGRAANRRVEVLILPNQQKEAEPTAAAEAEGKSAETGD